MKKHFRTFFSALAAVALAVCMLLSAACVPEETNVDPAQIVSIGVSGQKTTFEYGERFSSDGLVVTAKLDDETEKKLSAGQYTVDSSAYDRMQAGRYSIEVSLNGSALSVSYTVEVREREILPAPTLDNSIYAYNGMDPLFSERTINYEPATGSDKEWAGRYTVDVYAPGDEAHKQSVGMVAAYSQMHGQELGLSTVGSFDFNGTVVVRVQTDFSFETVDIRPFSLGIEYEVVEDMENTIEFTLTRPCNISVEFDGDTARNLVLFSSYMDVYSMPSDDFIAYVRENVGENDNLIVVQPGDVDINEIYAQYSDTKHNVIVFGKGLYMLKDGPNGAGGQPEFHLPSDSTMYIHGDAGIYGHLYVVGKNNVHIKGRGYVSGQMTGAGTILSVTDSRNVVAEDFIMYHSPGWTNVLDESQDITYRGIRLAGQRRNNNDGFDICNSSDVLVDDCWIRTIDDCVTIKARFTTTSTRTHIENIIVQNTTLWNYQGGNGIVVGSESCTDVYNNIVFRNIDIIHNTSHRAIAMEIIDSAHVTNTVFDDIRMELENDFYNYDHTYPYESDWRNPTKFLSLEIIPADEAYYGTDTEDGIIDGVIFNNIKFVGNPARLMEFKGASPDHMVSNVRLNNFNYNGTILNDYNFRSHLTEGSSNYQNVTFSAGDFYFEPEEDAVLIDDREIAFSGAKTYDPDDAELTGGGYTLSSVRIGDTYEAAFSTEEEGYFMPAVNLKTGLAGGVFDVAFDGVDVGRVNTYSETSEWMQFYLPMNYITQGEHTLTFTARSAPNAYFDGYMLDLGIDHVKFVRAGHNFIEFEELSAEENVAVGDALASGGRAVGFELQAGESLTFEGTNTLARGAQLLLTYLAGPDKGIYKFYFNGDLISTDIDMYAPSYEFRTVKMGTAQFPAGTYTITARCVGKNPASSGTDCRLDYVKTVHLPASKTYKSGLGGDSIAVSEGVLLDKGMSQPSRMSNITNGATITWSLGFRMPSDGVYEHRMVVSSEFDPSAFELLINGKKTDYEMKDGAITFRVPREVGDNFIVRLRCIGTGVYSFSWEKTVIEAVEIDKSDLKALVAAEDEREIAPDTADYLKENHASALAAAKEVLFARTSTQRQAELAEEALRVAASRLEGGRAQYTQTTLRDTSVDVSFESAAPGELAILYLQNGSESDSFYALVGQDGIAQFTVAEKYVGSEVKLYCEVVGDPLAGAEILEDGKVSSALDFLFDDGYWTAEKTQAHYFRTLCGSGRISVAFREETVAEGDIVMLSLRNLLDEELAVYYAAVDADCRAVFEIGELTQSGIYAVVRVALRPDAVVEDVQAYDVLLAEAAVGQELAVPQFDPDVLLTTTVTPDADGVIRYPASCGWKNNLVTISFDGEFDYVEIDLGILAYCGSGGPDAIYIYDAGNTRQLSSFAASGYGTLTRGKFTFSYEECGGGLVLHMWYGCAGDWEQCATHAPEELHLEAVRFYGTVAGDESALRLIGGSSVEVPEEARAFEGMRFDTLSGAQELTVSGAFAAGEQVTLTVKDRAGQTLGTYEAVCEQAGSVSFLLDGLTYDGPVSVFAMTQNGNVAMTSARVVLRNAFHLGKLMFGGGESFGWSVTKGNASLKIGEDGVICTDAESIYRQNYPDQSGKPVNGFDYYLNCAFDPDTVEQIEIEYAFNKICNCGGGDWFWIYSGTQSMGAFSCQDKPVGPYQGTIVMDRELLGKCETLSFGIFYGFGCSLSTHTGETLEFGTMTVTRYAEGERTVAVYPAQEDWPVFHE